MSHRRCFYQHPRLFIPMHCASACVFRRPAWSYAGRLHRKSPKKSQGHSLFSTGQACCAFFRLYFSRRNRDHGGSMLGLGIFCRSIGRLSASHLRHSSVHTRFFVRCGECLRALAVGETAYFNVDVRSLKAAQLCRSVFAWLFVDHFMVIQSSKLQQKN